MGFCCWYSGMSWCFLCFLGGMEDFVVLMWMWILGELFFGVVGRYCCNGNGKWDGVIGDFLSFWIVFKLVLKLGKCFMLILFGLGIFCVFSKVWFCRVVVLSWL